MQLNEIEAYITGRLLTASEAVWRILSLKLHKEFPSVMRLDIHLPNQQQVIFDPTADRRDILEMAERSTSSLLEWFALNTRDPAARRYLYTDIPEFYIWKNGTWMPRTLKGCAAVGRMYNVSIHNYELFALRSLLKCQRGCQSFEDVLMVDGVIYSTFRDACSAFGFTHDDSEFIACFTEYLDTTIASLATVREQFAIMLCAIKTLDAKHLFEYFAADLQGAESRSYALWGIEQCMRSIGRSLSDDDFQFDNVSEVEIIEQHTEIANLPSLSAEQREAVNDIWSMLNSDVGANKVMAVVAPAGTGKTLFVHHAVHELRARGCVASCVAASCLAATLLPQGKTAHAAFKIPLQCDDNSYCNWDPELRRQLSQIDVVFWDEVSMVSHHVADTVDRSFRRLMDNDEMFGGKVFVFLGDFRQLPPVVRGGRGEFFSLHATEWFQRAVHRVFTQNFRSQDAEYSSMLSRIGDGDIESVDIPSERIAESLETAIRRVYGSDITHPQNAANMMLAFTLDQCSIVNEAVFELIPGEPQFSDAVDDLSECKSPDEYPPEYVASLHIHGVPPAQIAFKPQSRFMIMRNLSPPYVCNGVLAELISCTRLLCCMKLLSGPGAGRTIKLPRCSFHVTSENSGMPFNFCRRQFPITPAYCVTVHKSQGQTLTNIGLIADTDPFAHGLVYVALSRVGSWSNVVFYSPRCETFLMNKVCKNLVAAVNT